MLNAIAEALWEFQAGPRAIRRRNLKKKKKPSKQPKWMKVRARRLPPKPPPTREVPLKRDVTKLRRPLPKVTPRKLLIIKRERAIFNTRSRPRTAG